MKIYILRGTAIRTESGESCAESVKEDSSAFLLTGFKVLTVGILGGGASCSLFILRGASQSNVFVVLVNDFLVARKISGYTIYVALFL